VQAFYGCPKLTSIEIPDNVKSIGNGAFCFSGLETVTIGTGVKEIDVNAFDQCYSLKQINYNATNCNSVGNNRSPFTACGKDAGSLSLIIGDGVISIPDYLFKAYESPDRKTIVPVYITSITIPNSVVTIGRYAFYCCNRLASVTIPDNVTEIGDTAFFDCSSLTSLAIGKGVSKIGVNAFDSCTRLETLTFNAANCAEIGNNRSPFTNCGKDSENLTVTIGEEVTKIPAYLFKAYEGSDGSKVPVYVKSVKIPKGVTSIGIDAFKGCESLTDVYYKGTADEWNKIVIGSGNESLTGATMHYNSAF
jgi:hypothetical protein